MSTIGSQRAADQWRALARRPGYRGFVATVLVSRIVGVMFNTAGILLILQRTHDPGLAGAVTAASVLPGALVGPLLGAWLDIARRRRVLIVSDQLLSVIVLLAIVALAGHGPDWTLPLVAILLGITRPFSVGSFVSAIAALAGPELLDRASAVEATSINLAIVIGPALAGALSGAIGPARVIELQAALTVLVAAAIAASPSFEARTPERAPSIREAMRVGLRTLARHRLLRATSIASPMANFCWGMMLVSFPLYAAHRLHAGQSASGFLWAAVALGSIVGTFALRSGSAGAGRIAVSYLMIGLSALLWLLAGSVLAAFALIVLTGIVEGPAYAGSIAVRQREAPAVARTQVLNTVGSFGQIAMSLGSIAGGVVSDPGTAFVVFAALNVIAALVVARAGRSHGDAGP